MSRAVLPRSNLPSSCLKAALVAAFCVWFAPGAMAKPAPEPQPAKKTQPLSLDDLYARLKAAGDDAEAKGVARLIEQRLGRSGSATADLLTERARQAMSS